MSYFLPGRITEVYTGDFDNIEIGYNGADLVALWNSSATQLMFSVSADDGETWSTPEVAYTSGSSFLLRGFVWGGSKWILAADSAGTSRLMDSTSLTSWTNSRVLTGIPATAISDLMYASGKYYLAGIRGNVVHIAESVDAGSWSDVEQVSSLNSIPSSEARLVKGTLTVAFKEGAVGQIDHYDRLLVSDVRSGITRPILSSSRPVSGASSGTLGDVVIYVDYSARNSTSIWKFLHRATDTWIDNGVFASYGNATTGAVVAGDDCFHIVYGQFTDDGIKIFHRKLQAVEDGIGDLPYQPADDLRNPSLKLPNFSVEISYGSEWLSITDHVNYRIDPSDFGSSSTQWRRISTTSPHYEGSYDIHAVRDNVNEQLTVTIYGQSQNHVTENILMLVAAVTQPRYRIRITVQDHCETWLCQRADYTVLRGHVFLHNTMAQLKMQVPRHPNASYQVVA